MPDSQAQRSRAFAVCRSPDTAPPELHGAVVAVGNFDGVHRGHRLLVETALREAERAGRPSAILTFDPHPRAFFRPDEPRFTLTPEPLKLRILRSLGPDGAFVLPFDAALAATSARDFVGDLVRARLGASALVVGNDFHFGRGREGSPAVLADLARQFGLGVTLVPTLEVEGRPVSSSRIRDALASGRLDEANRLLGYRWLAEGEVVHGDKRGRTLGFPTANMRLDPGCRLAHGIYAVRASLEGGEIRDGVASFGRRPTFDDGAPLLETFLFDFQGDLYGRTIAVELVTWIRGEERFDSAAALVRRMNADREHAILALRGGDDLPSVL